MPAAAAPAKMSIRNKNTLRNVLVVVAAAVAVIVAAVAIAIAEL